MLEAHSPGWVILQAPNSQEEAAPNPGKAKSPPWRPCRTSHRLSTHSRTHCSPLVLGAQRQEVHIQQGSDDLSLCVYYDCHNNCHGFKPFISIEMGKKLKVTFLGKWPMFTAMPLRTTSPLRAKNITHEACTCFFSTVFFLSALKDL